MNRSHSQRTMVPEAFKVLPPLSPELPPPPRAPQPHRVAPPVTRREKTAFVILNDERPPPGSRGVSPSGRVSPFRGRGFKEESSIRYVASREPSPTPGDDRRGRSRSRLGGASPTAVRADSTCSNPGSPSRIPKPISRRSSLSPNRATQVLNQVNRNKSTVSPSPRSKVILKQNGVGPTQNGTKPPISSKRVGPAPNTRLNNFSNAAKPPLPKSTVAGQRDDSKNVTSPNRRRNQPSKPDVTRSPSRIPRTRSVSRGREGNVRATSPTRAVIRVSPRIQHRPIDKKNVNSEKKPPNTATGAKKNAVGDRKTAGSEKKNSSVATKNVRNSSKNSSPTEEKENPNLEVENKVPTPVDAIVSTLPSAEEKTPTLEKKDVQEDPVKVSQSNTTVESPPPPKPAAEEGKTGEENDKKVPEEKQEDKKDEVPEATVTLVRTTTQPAMELAQPDVIPTILAKGEQEISKSISEGPSVEDKCENPGEVLASVESVRSSTSMETVRAVARVRGVAQEGAEEVLSANNLMKTGSNGRNIAWENKSPEISHMNNSVHPVNPVLPLQPPKKQGCCGRLSEKLCCSFRCCKCKKTPPGCTKLGTRLGELCSKLNCCKKKNAPAAKPKPQPEQSRSRMRDCLARLNCFRGSKCCQRKPPQDAGDEEEGNTGCCGGGKCKDRCRRCYSGLLCLNLGCCQKLRACCRCDRLACCREGGCCGPSPSPAQLDRRKSKMSIRKPSISQGIPKLDPTLVEHQSMMRGAVPVLPIPLAWFCCFLNVFLPGTGTLMSGVFCLCFGKPRFSINDNYESRLTAFSINLIVSVSQLFTVIFCLVGWGWSVWWGVMMVKFARKQKRILLAEKTTEDATPAPIAVNQNHDVERAR